MNFYEEVLKRKDDLLRDLETLLRIESVKDLERQTKKRPMGEKIGEALETMLSITEFAGFQPTNIEGMVGYAEYSPAKAEDYIGILCHLDVVPATGDWSTPPFEPTIRDGKLYARGAIDDKGPTIAAYYGLKIVKELGLPLKHNIRIIFGTDEESGMSCMKKYAEVEKMPLAGFAPDADFPIIHAEKGQINVKLGLQKISTNDRQDLSLLSFVAGEKGNMVPDVAEAIIGGQNDTLVPQFLKYCKEKGVEYSYSLEGNQTMLKIVGTSAHGMEPHKGVNAALILASFLQPFSFEGSSNDYIQFISKTLYNQFKGEGLGIDFADDITGPLTVNAGIFRFVKDDIAEIHLNIRCPVETNYDATIENLTKTVESYSFKVTSLTTKEPHHVPKDSPMIKALQEVYQTETGEEPTLLTTGGATYARFIKNGVAFGAVFPGKPMTAHQKNEYIEIDDLLKATAIYAHAIYRLGNL
ncbi:dipeptidase PepV [Bacillus timonensis]|uniref:dipeptidase PepV n=1 Tax=Bacillus timonensis TaxID=1033734 RepID=UPI0002896A04|nr:dipeptidase PepV [Bacillus timonensis]